MEYGGQFCEKAFNREKLYIINKSIVMEMIRSFVFAWNGIRICFASERNFRIHVISAIIVSVLALLFQISVIEWAAIGFCIVLVIIMEMLNSAIEKLCNIVHKDHHPGIKKVKDIAAGAVLVSAIFSLVAGLVIFLPKIFSYLKSI